MKKLLSWVSIYCLCASPLYAVTTTTTMSYGTNNQTITHAAITANTAQSGSTAIDNTSNLFLEALVTCKFTTAGSGTSTTGFINIWGYGTTDGGTNYSDGVSGSSATYTLTSPANVKLLGIINAVANSTTYVGGPFAVSPGFGGTLPDHWGIVIENKTGGSTSAGACTYQGIKLQNQ